MMTKCALLPANKTEVKADTLTRPQTDHILTHPEHAQQTLGVRPAASCRKVRASRKPVQARDVSTQNGVTVAQSRVRGDNAVVVSGNGHDGSAVVDVRLESCPISNSKSGEKIMLVEGSGERIDKQGHFGTEHMGEY